MHELDLLRGIYGHNRDLPERVVVPPGDDMAAIRLGDGVVLVTVDQVADGVHVNLDGAPLELVGRKAITRSLSDVAAMAARPIGAIVAAALPRDFGEDRAHALFDAMRSTGQRYGCPLVGGDIGFWDQRLLLTVTVLAEPAGIVPILRSDARAGDVICVSGELGGAWERGGGGRHLSFEPRIQLARELATIEGLALHAMIDLSDGLASDLSRICERSGVAAEIEVGKLPVSEAARAAAQRDGRPPWAHALCDGEDYELCFTISAMEPRTMLPEAIDGVPISRIGRIIERSEASDESPIRLLHPDGHRQPLTGSGWEHRG